MNWSKLPERGTFLGLMVLGTFYRLLGRRVCLLLGFPVVLYFFLTCRKRRKASREYLKKVYRMKHKKATALDGLKHFMSFFGAMLDKFAAALGRVNPDEVECEHPDVIQRAMSAPGGGILFVSHIGCIEFCQAMMSDDQKKRMHILVHSKNALAFNRALDYFHTRSNVNMMEVSSIGPDTIMVLKDRLEKSDWIAIAADRTPISENPRVTFVPFLGADGPFSQGPYILASLLQAPVYTATAIRIGSKYQVFFELFAEKIVLQKGRKEACINAYARQYASYLENYCTQYPFQWYNFYDFWAPPPNTGK